VAIYHNNVPGILPSGEQFDFGFFSISDSLDTAVGGLDAFYVELAGNADFKKHFKTTTVFSEGKVSEIVEATGRVDQVALAGTAFAGSATAEPLPPQISACVSVNTAILSRRTRGRFYLPAGIIDDVTAAGRMESACQTDLVEALAEAFMAMSGADTVLAVYSRTAHNVTPAINIGIGDVWDTMRTRRDKLVEVRSVVSVV